MKINKSWNVSCQLLSLLVGKVVGEIKFGSAPEKVNQSARGGNECLSRPGSACLSV